VWIEEDLTRLKEARGAHTRIGTVCSPHPPRRWTTSGAFEQQSL